MDNIKSTIGVSAIVAAVITLTVVTFLWMRPATTTTSTQPDRPLGALAGPDIPSPYLRWGDVAVFKGRMALNTATSTPCALQSPAATSTLISASLQIQTPTSTATFWQVAKAASGFATTTALNGHHLVASGALSTVVASTTQSDATDDSMVFGPSQWLVWGAEGFLPADATKLNGVCQATWEVNS